MDASFVNQTLSVSKISKTVFQTKLNSARANVNIKSQLIPFLLSVNKILDHLIHVINDLSRYCSTVDNCISELNLILNVYSNSAGRLGDPAAEYTLNHLSLLIERFTQTSEVVTSICKVYQGYAEQYNRWTNDIYYNYTRALTKK